MRNSQVKNWIKVEFWFFQIFGQGGGWGLQCLIGETGQIVVSGLGFYCTVELQSTCNDPLYEEVLGVMNDFLYPSNSKVYKKSLDITKPCYSEQFLLVPWPFIISRFCCTLNILVIILKINWQIFFRLMACLYSTIMVTTLARQ